MPNDQGTTTTRTTIVQAPPIPPQVPKAPELPKIGTETGAHPHQVRVHTDKDGTTTIQGSDGSQTVIDNEGNVTTSGGDAPLVAGTVAQPPSMPVIPSQAVDITLAFFLMIAFICVGVPLARAFARRMDRRSAAPATDPDEKARLERIEAALEAVALEVERIGEGQRYVTQLMAQREPAMAKLGNGLGS